MARTRPSLCKLCEMDSGAFGDFFAVLAEKTRGSTREGKPFYTCRFRDEKRAATFMVWGDGAWYDQCEHVWQVGTIFKVRAEYGEHERYGPQIAVHQIRPINEEDECDTARFRPRADFDVDARHGELLDLASNHIADPGLRRLVLTLLERHAEPLKQLPATPRHFYPHVGGLVDHLASVTRLSLGLVEKLRDKYPELDRDLVVAGALLHDIGRVLELEESALTVQPSEAGRLFGHMILGRDLIRDTARELGDLDGERLQLLEHIVVAHLNHPEWGSPRLPLIPECLIIHHADDLDAKVEMYMRCLRQDQAPGRFTERDPILNRQLYKRMPEKTSDQE